MFVRACVCLDNGWSRVCVRVCVGGRNRATTPLPPLYSSFLSHAHTHARTHTSSALSHPLSSSHTHTHPPSRRQREWKFRLRTHKQFRRGFDRNTGSIINCLSWISDICEGMCVWSVRVGVCCMRRACVRERVRVCVPVG